MGTHLRIRRQDDLLPAGGGAQLIVCALAMLEAWEHDDLSAPYWRWYWNDRPGARVTDATGRVVGLGPGRVVLIPPHTPFATTLAARRPVGHLHLHFTAGAAVRDEARRVIVRRPSTSDLRAIRRLAARLREGDGTGDRPAHFAAHALANAALAEVPADAWRTTGVDAAIARVLTAMHERPADRLDNRALAAIAALGENTLLRRFAAVTGTSPHHYLLRLRVDRAAAALRTSADGLDAIAAATGFYDRAHLTRAFRACLQTTPSAFREAVRPAVDGRRVVAP